MITRLFKILLIGTVSATATTPISLDDFKNIGSEYERDKVISAAPEAQKEALRKISRHLRSVARSGGEAAYKLDRERTASAYRGLLDIERIFLEYPQIVGAYEGPIEKGFEKAGTSKEDHEAFLRQSNERYDENLRRIDVVHRLVLNAAPSEAALALNREAKVLLHEMDSRIGELGDDPTKTISLKEKLGYDARMEDIYNRVQHLPKLPADQVQREVDAIQDDMILH